MAKTCPICETRRAKRFCPGLATSRWARLPAPPAAGPGGQAGTGETICAPCCGSEREVSIDCPSTCTYLMAARRYETRLPARLAGGRGQAAPKNCGGQAEHRKPAAELAFPEVLLSEEFVAEQQPVVAHLILAILRFAREQPKLAPPKAGLADPEVLEALERLAKTFQTLASGLYYEQPPEGAWARELYAALRSAIEAYQREHQQKTGLSLRPGDVLKVVVFLLRVGHVHANGRPLSRAFLDFLRAQFSAETAARPESRLIIPGA